MSAKVKHSRRAAKQTTRQLDLFIAKPETPLITVRVKMDRSIDRDRPCCLNFCIVRPADGPHAGELICADCGQHRAWLSNTTALWIEDVITRFGAPTAPIVVRKSQV
jgi:hypothetical protein